MTRAAPPLLISHQSVVPRERSLGWQMLALSMPVFAEFVLTMIVGINDTYLANKLPHDAAAAGAAVGTITYLIWFFNLLVGAVGTGSTAIIARAKGARHRRQANSVTGQSMSAAVLLGVLVGGGTLIFARQVIGVSGLNGAAQVFALPYLRMLSATLPFMLAMNIAGSCLRGNGNTLAPAVVLILVNVLNIIFSWGLCRGLWGLPAMGFNGIATGTIIAYVAGGVMMFWLLRSGRAGLKLHLHRMRPHASMIKRLFKIGLPAGVESMLNWVANFGVIYVINKLDATYAMANAHMNAIRIESISFMTGMAFAAAAATMVGQSLGMNDPKRAERSAYLAYAAGGGAMTLAGIGFIFFGRYPAAWLSPDAHIAALTTQCLFITGFIQSGFAAYAVFSGALRGAGDTFVVMLASLASVLGVRLVGVIIVGGLLHKGLGAIWVVLASELFLRGVLSYARFWQGGWKRVKV